MSYFHTLCQYHVIICLQILANICRVCFINHQRSRRISHYIIIMLLEPPAVARRRRHEYEGVNVDVSKVVYKTNTHLTTKMTATVTSGASKRYSKGNRMQRGVIHATFFECFLVRKTATK